MSPPPGGAVPPAALARFRALPRHEGETWQGGLVRLPTWVEEPDGSIRRPWAGVWVALATGMVNLEVEQEGAPVDWSLALRALVGLGLRFTGSRPAALEVADEALGHRLGAELGDPALAVAVRGSLPDVQRVLREMAQHLHRGTLPPEALEAPGVTVEHLRAFADAARAFYEAAPWEHLSDEDLIRVEAPEVAPGLRHLVVMGAGGQTLGLGFFSSPEEFEDERSADQPELAVGPGGRWAVTYGPLDLLPPGDADLWEAHGLPVAGPQAYPLAFWVGPGDQVRRPGAGELADVEGLLRALARSTEAQIDSGRWSHQVDTRAGRRTVTLAIPDLLAPPEAPPRPRPGLPDRRIMERMLLEMERFSRTAGFASQDEALEAIRQRFSVPLDELPSTASTPLERAQDLVFRAVEARGRRRLQLARRALELSPDCADAYVLLAEASRGPEAACRLYEQGVGAGERALGPAVFAEEAGHFWGLVSTRPYMRARFGLARCLEDLGRRPEAILHYEDLLRLNPADNQGVRYALLSALVLQGRDGEALALLDRFGDEPSALWRYGRALAAFRVLGDSQAARQALRRALRTNRHVPGFLTGREVWPGPEPGHYGLGTPEEAVVCDAEQGGAWRATPGATEWLATHARQRKGGRRRRR